jgi:hypothetical protein
MDKQRIKASAEATPASTLILNFQLSPDHWYQHPPHARPVPPSCSLILQKKGKKKNDIFACLR